VRLFGFRSHFSFFRILKLIHKKDSVREGAQSYFGIQTIRIKSKKLKVMEIQVIKPFLNLVFMLLFCRCLLEFSNSGKQTYECLGGYLKGENFLENDITTNKYNGSGWICRGLIKIQTVLNERWLKSLLQNNGIIDLECIDKNLRKNHLSTIFMKWDFYRLSSFSNETLALKQNILEIVIDESMHDTLVECANYKNEERFLDNQFDAGKKLGMIFENVRVIDDAVPCYVRYFHQKKILDEDFLDDLRERAPKMQPEENCHEFLNALKLSLISVYLDFYDQKKIESQKFIECFSVLAEEHLIYDKLLAVIIGSHLGMTVEQKEVEKRDHIRRYKKFSKAVISVCRKSNLNF
jgi:hypothetical protein